MSLASVVNAAGNIYTTLVDLSPKQFYSIRDFYNFIKKRQNAPMAVRHFTVVPKMQIFSLTGSISRVWEKIFTDTNLAKFSILTQQIQMPSQIGVVPVGATADEQFKSPHGNYKPMPNGFPGSSNRGTFQMHFLETASPIIQTFIVPWFYQTLRTANYQYDPSSQKNDDIISQLKQSALSKMTSLGNDALKALGIQKYKFGKDKGKGTKYVSQYPAPKLTLDIKYYRMDQIAGLQFMMNPNFVYRLTGVYPVAFNAPTTQHRKVEGQMESRIVEFAYNNIICIPNAQYEQMLFNGSHTAFPYKTQSPVQILNSLNSGIQSVASIGNSIKNM